MKQIKLIDKSKKEDFSSEPNKEILNDLERLQLYAENFLKKTQIDNNNNSESASSDPTESSNESDSQTISQAEVESLMPSVSLFKIVFKYIIFSSFKWK